MTVKQAQKAVREAQQRLYDAQRQEWADSEPDIAAMLTDAETVNDAHNMLFMEQMLRELGPENRIGRQVREMMREHGWRVAYEALAAYTANGCGMKG